MTGDCGLHRLANPPDRVRDELDPPVWIELPGRGHEAEIAFADQIDERDTPILELLGHRNYEANIVAGEPFLCGHIALERLPGQLHLLFPIEERNSTDFIEIQIQTFTAFIDCTSDLRRSHRATLATCLNRHANGLLRTPALTCYSIMRNLGPAGLKWGEYII